MFCWDWHNGIACHCGMSHYLHGLRLMINETRKEEKRREEKRKGKWRMRSIPAGIIISTGVGSESISASPKCLRACASPSFCNVRIKKIFGRRRKGVRGERRGKENL